MRHLTAAVTAVCALASAPAFAEGFQEAWRSTEGLSAPESAIYDAGTNALYITNVNSAEPGASGYVSKFDLEGKLVAQKFADGLSQPKGTAIKDGKLYAAGTNQLAEIDLASGAVTLHEIANAPLLNDITVGPDGALYITETISGSIYRFADGKAEIWLQDAAIAGINGIVADGERFVIAIFGDLSGGFENVKPGQAKQIDIATKAVTAFGPQGEIGMLDGIHLVDGAAYATSNATGELLKITEDGTEAEVVFQLIAEPGPNGAGAADQAWAADQGLLVVPLMMHNEIVALKAE